MLRIRNQLNDEIFAVNMESGSVQLVDTEIKCCDCECESCSANPDGFRVRSVKRKLDERDDGDLDVLFIPGVSDSDVALVDMGNECIALREIVNSQQETIEELSVELDEERNAASSAANEAMSMILRLQSEKSEAQMEARQFKRFSEEKMAHDQEEIMELEDLLYQRDQTIEALTYEVHAYKHRMSNYGLIEPGADGEDNNTITPFELPLYNYPPLKCNLIENHADPDSGGELINTEKYMFVDENPRSLNDIKERVSQLEDSPVQEKVIISSEFGDDTNDRIYTVDSVKNVASFNDDSKANFTQTIGVTEVKQLYARLHALEADRESMKQALISMRTEKAQLVLLNEIAQHLRKDVSASNRMPVKKQSLFGSFSFVLIFKWVVSIFFWRRPRRIKYMFGMSASNAGLRMLVNKGGKMGQWRCLSRTRFLKY